MMGARRRIRRAFRDHRGLTAIELAVVVAILAVLAAIVAGNTTGMSTSARGSSQATDISEVQKGVDRWVGEQPASRYPVKTPTIVSWNGTPSAAVSVVTPTPASNGLPASGGLYVYIDFADTFTPPEGTAKPFIPNYMQRAPKHSTPTANSWVIDKDGKVWNLLSGPDY